MSVIRKNVFLCVMIGIMAGLSACAHQSTTPAPLDPMPPVYDYPIENAYAATIIGTPANMKYNGKNVIEPKERKLVLYPDRKIPEGFWYYDALYYGEMMHDREAPLIYLIGGTGSGYKSRYSVALANTLYHAGYHVVLLPSPTHSNFIVTASENFFPGNAEADSRDLYHVMKRIQNKVTKHRSVTSTHMIGYSLGGWNAAFVSHLDAQEKAIGFGKVLLINPPLNLHASLVRLDAMLLRGLENGIDGLDAFLDNAIARLSRMRRDSDAFDFTNEDMLLEGYRQLRPSDDSMATTIGLAFRLSAANMVFTSDIMSHANYIYPADKPFNSDTPLNDYMAIAIRTSLGDYYRDVYATYYSKNNPAMTNAELERQSGLPSIGGWLSQQQNIGLITNRNDVILAEGDLEQLEAMFAGRSWVFPTGGHLGNMQHPAVAWRILKFFEEVK